MDKCLHNGVITKILKKKGVLVSKGTLIGYMKGEGEGGKTMEIRCETFGKIEEIFVKVGSIVKVNDILFKIEPCKHQSLMGNSCTSCGQVVETQKNTVKLNIKGSSISLVVHKDSAKELASEHVKSLITRERLILVLDLDQTLLEASEDPRAKEVSLNPLYSKDIINFPMDRGELFVKFRPGLTHFLQEGSKLFDLFVYTHGTRSYATKILAQLDPTNELFRNRIMSRTEDEATSSKQREPQPKDLKRMFPKETSMVMVLDDKKSVWPHDESNIIQVFPYSFWSQIFQHGKENTEALPSENETQLLDCLHVLNAIHGLFYSKLHASSLSYLDVINGKGPRVSELLIEKQRSLLAGKEIVFSGVIPSKVEKIENEKIWRRATLCGARCTKDLQNSTSHLVANKFGTEKVKIAKGMGSIWIINPLFIDFCYHSWTTPNEIYFPVAELEGYKPSLLPSSASSNLRGETIIEEDLEYVDDDEVDDAEAEKGEGKDVGEEKESVNDEDDEEEDEEEEGGEPKNKRRKLENRGIPFSTNMEDSAILAEVLMEEEEDREEDEGGSQDSDSNFLSFLNEKVQKG